MHVGSHESAPFIARFALREVECPRARRSQLKTRYDRLCAAGQARAFGL
jgi:hypothetical protein